MKKILLAAAAAAMTATAAWAWEMEPEPVTVTYVAEVEAGDTLWDLAERLARPEDDVRRIVWEIRKQNGIEDARDIQPGQMIRVNVRTN